MIENRSRRRASALCLNLFAAWRDRSRPIHGGSRRRHPTSLLNYIVRQIGSYLDAIDALSVRERFVPVIDEDYALSPNRGGSDDGIRVFRRSDERDSDDDANHPDEDPILPLQALDPCWNVGDCRLHMETNEILPASCSRFCVSTSVPGQSFSDLRFGSLHNPSSHSLLPWPGLFCWRLSCRHHDGFRKARKWENSYASVWSQVSAQRAPSSIYSEPNPTGSMPSTN